MFDSFSNPQTAQHLAGRHPGTRGDHRPNPNRPDPAPGDGERPARHARKPPGHEIDTLSLSRLLSLLADRTRLRILWLLADGERAVGAMTTELGLPQPTVSHHLAWLRTMHLVSPRRAGKNVFYALGRAARTEPDGSLSLMTADTVVTIRGKDFD